MNYKTNKNDMEVNDEVRQLSTWYPTNGQECVLTGRVFKIRIFFLHDFWPNKRHNSLIFCNNYMHNVSEWKFCTI